MTEINMELDVYLTEEQRISTMFHLQSSGKLKITIPAEGLVIAAVKAAALLREWDPEPGIHQDVAESLEEAVRAMGVEIVVEVR